jgi:tyrosine-protein phosphatase YwqE
LKKLKSLGVFFQLNLLSLTGYYGTTITKNAVHLLDNNLYDFSGTDLHNEQQVDNLRNSRIQYPNKKKLIELLEKNYIFNN